MRYRCPDLFICKKIPAFYTCKMKQIRWKTTSLFNYYCISKPLLVLKNYSKKKLKRRELHFFKSWTFRKYLWSVKISSQSIEQKKRSSAQKLTCLFQFCRKVENFSVATSFSTSTKIIPVLTTYLFNVRLQARVCNYFKCYHETQRNSLSHEIKHS